MKKLEAMAKKLNAEFRNDLATEIKNRFNLEVESNFNFGMFRLVTTRVDGQDFTPEQMAFMQAYEAGYMAAISRVRDEGRQ